MIDSIVKYIVWKLQEAEWSINKTKIVKLLYLVDIEHFRQYRETATGFAWKYHYYGPYATDIEDVFRRLSLDLPKDEVMTVKGYKAHVFRSSEEAEFEFNANVPQRVRLATERVLRKWAPEELNPLLSHVYFDTEPMRHAQPGDLLNFEHIPAPRLERKLDESVIRLTSEELSRLKTKLEEHKKKQTTLAAMSERQGKRLPSPRNRAYINAKATMDNEERRPLPVNVDVVVES